MSSTDSLRFHEPSLVDRRGGRILLVWGDLARWLAVDEELYAFLCRFDGQRPLKQVVRKHARKWNRLEAEVAEEARTLVGQLRKQGILRTDSGPGPMAPEPVRIANVTVNLTNRCNLRCPFCYNVERKTDEVDVDRLMDALEAGRDLLAPGASFIILGGEPLLDWPRTRRAVERAERLFDSPILISTNGTLLSDDIVADLARHRVEVQVSLDGPTAAEHDPGRGRGVFELATAGVRKLVGAGIRTILSMVYTRGTEGRFEPYLYLARGLGSTEARFIPMRRIGGGCALAEQMPDQLAAFRTLLDVLQRRPELRPLLGRDWFSIAMAVCRFAVPRTGCGIGRQVLFVDADGTVYPCPNHVAPELAAGRLTETPLADIVLTSPVFEAMRDRYRVDRYTACRSCAFRHWCVGDCRGEALSVFGDPHAPSPHCAQLKKLYPELLWLLADNDPRLGNQVKAHGQRAEEIFL